MGLWVLFKKELLGEFRSRESLVSMVVFAVAVILIFAFSFNASPSEFQRFLPGLIWVSYFFTAILGLLRNFAAEKEMDAWSLLLSSPLFRSHIFFAKVAAFCLFLVITQSLTLPLFFLFLNIQFSSPLQIAGLFVLSDLGIAALGVLISALSFRTRMGEVLLPVLLFPLLTPVIIAATKSFAAILAGQPFSSYQVWITILFSVAIVFLVFGMLLFHAITED